MYLRMGRRWITIKAIRINLLFYLFFHRPLIQQLCFFSVGLSSLIRHFQQFLWVLKFILSPGLGSWQLEFKSLIIVIVGFLNFQAFFLVVTWPELLILDFKSLMWGEVCILPKPGDRSNFNTHKTCWKFRINDERPTEKKHNSWMGRRWKNR